jgi:hypothetical protein
MLTSSSRACAGHLHPGRGALLASLVLACGLSACTRDFSRFHFSPPDSGVTNAHDSAVPDAAKPPFDAMTDARSHDDPDARLPDAAPARDTGPLTDAHNDGAHSPHPDAKVDAMSDDDAQTAVDSGMAMRDSGMQHDSGTPHDSGTLQDIDAHTLVDAHVPPPDTGPPPPHDAGITEAQVMCQTQWSLNDFHDTDCAACSCGDKCIVPVMNCFTGGAELGDQEDCTSLMACALRAGCRDWDCYCSDQMCGKDIAHGNGPCAAEMDRAARGTNDRQRVLLIYDELDKGITEDLKSVPMVRALQAVGCVANHDEGSKCWPEPGACVSACKN